MKSSIKNYCDRRIAEFDQISEDRKAELKKLVAYLRYKENDPVQLIFVGHQNARRSLFAQVWCKVAANYFQKKNVETYSMGEEETEIASNIVYTFMSLGFDLFVEGDDLNSRHFFVFDTRLNACICFSKTQYHRSVPHENFGTIFISSDTENTFGNKDGNELLLMLPFDDPQKSDGTSEAQQEYRKCSNQIAREMLYVFSEV